LILGYQTTVIEPWSLDYFWVDFRITNNCDRTLELEQNLDLNSEKISWVGVTNTNLGLLEPGGSIKVIF